MGFLSSLFGGKKEASEEKRLEDEAKSFDRLKYDGVKAVRTGQYVIAIKCLKAALEINDDLETRDYLAQALVRNGELLPTSNCRHLPRHSPTTKPFLSRWQMWHI